MNSKSCSPSISFYIEDEHRRTETKWLNCSYFVYIAKTYSGTIFSSLWLEARMKDEECPVKLLSNQFQLLVEQEYQYSCMCSRRIYGKHCKPSMLLFHFYLFTAPKLFFVLHCWNLTSKLLRRKNLHLPFRSCVSLPTGRPNRCRILLFNAFSNDSFLKWLKHYL